MIEMKTCLCMNQWIDELIWNMNSTMSKMNEFMHSVISQSMNSSVQWIHLVPNDLDEFVYTQESMIKWTHLLHEVNCTMNSFSHNFNEFIYLQSCIKWIHLIHEFNYEENQWMNSLKSWILEVRSDLHPKHFWVSGPTLTQTFRVRVGPTVTRTRTQTLWVSGSSHRTNASFNNPK